MRRRTPTENPDALGSFGAGYALFNRYLRSGNLDDLSEAAQRFGLSVAFDPNFGEARFYRAVSLTALGDDGSTTQAIEDLLALIDDARFGLDARVQLAHPYVRASKYDSAEEELQNAEAKAQERICSSQGPDRRRVGVL
jgi:tetratricopeptide (TPR) repeat protein